MADCLELNAREESQEKGREIIRQIDGWLMDASPKSRQKLREHWQSKAGRGLSGEGGQAGRADGKGAKTVWMRKRYVLSCV